MNNPVRRLTIHGMMLQIPYWFGCCTYFAFIVTTLIEHGWADSSATGAVTAMAVISMLAQPVGGYISDRFLSEKKLSVLLLVMTTVCILLLPLSLGSGSKVLVLVNMAGITVSATQVGGLIDAWIVGLKQEYPSINYGLIRGTGSLAFSVSAQVAGLATIAFGHSARLWIGGGSVLLAIFAALTFRPARRDRPTDGKPIRKLGGKEAFKLVFASKQYKLLLSVSFCLMLSNAAMMTLNQLLIRDFGGTTAQTGTATAVMSGSEVPMMFFMAVILKKVGFKRLLLFCSTVYVVRMLVTASVTTVNGLISTQLMQGLTFAVLVPVAMSYLSRIVDERVRSTAVTTYAAITASLTGILGNLITSSLLATGFSAQTALIVFACSAFVGFSLTLYGVLRKIW
ncbi:MAG: MFS transporter [Oscillospiraceae bacterium]|nr:MFS transporter [Oscillospiraceae bacterium]